MTTTAKTAATVAAPGATSASSSLDRATAAETTKDADVVLRPQDDNRRPLPERRVGKPLTVDLDEVEETQEELRRPYWVGVTKDCPFSHVTAGSVSFELVKGQTVDSRGRPAKIQRYGRQVHMSDAELAVVLERLNSKVVRMVGGRPRQMTRKAKRFRHSPMDVPLACFVYIVPGGESQMTIESVSTTPPPLAEIPVSAREGVGMWRKRLKASQDTEAAKVAVADDADTFTEDWSDIERSARDGSAQE